MFCSNCGFQVADGSKFCPQCGTPVAVPVAPAAEPEAEKVAEAVVEKVEEPVVEKVAEPVAERIEPVVEPAPAVEPVEVEPAKVEEAPAVEPAPAVENVEVESAKVEPAAVEPAPAVEAVAVAAAGTAEAVAVEAAPAVENVAVEAVQVETNAVVEPAIVEPAPAVEPAPFVEPVAVEPTPAVGPTPAVEPAPYVAGYANQSEAPAPQANVQPGVAPAPAPEKPKKKKKVWLIILIILLALLLVGGCIIGVIVAIVISVTKKAGNAINNIVNDPAAYGIVTSEPSYGGAGTDLAYDLSVNDLVGKTFAGDIQLVSVSGAESMIDYLESVSGTTMSDSEKDSFRYPSISSMPYCELYIYDDEYSTGGWNFKLPYASGISSPELRQFSDWDMLTQEMIDEGTHFDSVAIRPSSNNFYLKNQVPDQNNLYAGNLFQKYSDYMSNGQFGIQFGGDLRKDRITGNSYGIDGTFVLMFWYDTMDEPYVLTYSYQVDDVAASSAGGAGNGTNGTDGSYNYDDLFDENGNINYDNFDFDDFNWE